MVTNSSLLHAHVLVSGRVQGVGYRAATWETATDLGLTGWVRNLPDGRVEASFEGEERAIAAMLRWCNRGPRLAQVTAVDVQYKTLEGFQEFQIRRT